MARDPLDDLRDVATQIENSEQHTAYLKGRRDSLIRKVVPKRGKFTQEEIAEAAKVSSARVRQVAAESAWSSSS